MKPQTICHLAIIALMACLVQSVSAQDSHWNGTLTNNLWNNPNNWNPVGRAAPGKSHQLYRQLYGLILHPLMGIR